MQKKAMIITNPLKEKSVEETAYACGFNSPQQYYLNFKKIHNCAPKEYLKNQL